MNRVNMISFENLEVYCHRERCVVLWPAKVILRLILCSLCTCVLWLIPACDSKVDHRNRTYLRHFCEKLALEIMNNPDSALQVVPRVSTDDPAMQEAIQGAKFKINPDVRLWKKVNSEILNGFERGNVAIAVSDSKLTEIVVIKFDLEFSTIEKSEYEGYSWREWPVVVELVE